MAVRTRCAWEAGFLCFILDTTWMQLSKENHDYDRDPPLSIHLKIISLCLRALPLVSYPSIISEVLRGRSCKYWGRSNSDAIAPLNSAQQIQTSSSWGHIIRDRRRCAGEDWQSSAVEVQHGIFTIVRESSKQSSTL
jgi:hypothetical protein